MIELKDTLKEYEDYVRFVEDIERLKQGEIEAIIFNLDYTDVGLITNNIKDYKVYCSCDTFGKILNVLSKDGKGLIAMIRFDIYQVIEGDKNV